MVLVRKLPFLVRDSQIVPKNAINEMVVQVMSTTMEVMKITSAKPTQGARKMLGVHKNNNGPHAIKVEI